MDEQVFMKSFMVMCEMFDKTPSAELTALYSMALDDLSDTEFKQAVANVINTHRYANLPKPVDLREAVRGSADDKGVLAVQVIEDAIRKYGSGVSLYFEDIAIGEIVRRYTGGQEMFNTGWAGLCTVTVDDWKFERPRLAKLYNALIRQPLPPLEICHGMYGNQPDHQAETVYIGDKDNIQRLLVGTEGAKLKELGA